MHSWRSSRKKKKPKSHNKSFTQATYIDTRWFFYCYHWILIPQVCSSYLQTTAPGPNMAPIKHQYGINIAPIWHQCAPKKGTKCITRHKTTSSIARGVLTSPSASNVLKGLMKVKRAPSSHWTINQISTDCIKTNESKKSPRHSHTLQSNQERLYPNYFYIPDINHNVEYSWGIKFRLLSINSFYIEIVSSPSAPCHSSYVGQSPLVSETFWGLFAINYSTLHYSSKLI